jgi:DNA repair ATPase RecN
MLAQLPIVGSSRHGDLDSNTDLEIVGDGWFDQLTERGGTKPLDQQQHDSNKRLNHISLKEDEAACDGAWKTWKFSKANVEALPECRLSVEQRHALLQRQGKLRQSTERLSQLEDAMNVLHADIEASHSASQLLNDRVFENLARAFGESMAAALPGFEFRAECTSKHAADGVRIVFRKTVSSDKSEPNPKRQKRAESALAPNVCLDASHLDSDTASQSGEWMLSLSELSGGQRSLCSLAFILAATQAGAAPALMLVDEVDAALDEVNQTRVGDMLQQCSKRSKTQVWAVSHSLSFQGWCDTFVKVRQDCCGRGTVAEIATVPR